MAAAIAALRTRSISEASGCGDGACKFCLAGQSLYASDRRRLGGPRARARARVRLSRLRARLQCLLTRERRQARAD